VSDLRDKSLVSDLRVSLESGRECQSLLLVATLSALLPLSLALSTTLSCLATLSRTLNHSLLPCPSLSHSPLSCPSLSHSQRVREWLSRKWQRVPVYLARLAKCAREQKRGSERKRETKKRECQCRTQESERECDKLSEKESERGREGENKGVG